MYDFDEGLGGQVFRDSQDGSSTGIFFTSYKGLCRITHEKQRVSCIGRCTVSLHVLKHFSREIERFERLFCVTYHGFGKMT